MELTAPAWLGLLALVPVAAWLARRARGAPVAHLMWFLIAPGASGRRRGGRAARSRLLWVAAVAAIALAAAAPMVVDRGGAWVLVVDLSATRALDLDAVRAPRRRLRRGRPRGPRRAAALARRRAAAAALVPGPGTVDAAGLADAVAAALPGARAVELAPAPPPWLDVGIAAIEVARDAAAPRHARIIVTLARHGGVAAPALVEARAADGAIRGRGAVTAAGDDRAVAVLDYAGDGDEALTLIADGAADPIAADDRATVWLPPLAPAPVWIDPALAGGPVARALAVLPTVTAVAALAPGRSRWWRRRRGGAWRAR
ncbi:MAG: hypothetical protein H6708_01700 [Kofleriaceae bacterium]|nr:hypothetical protein [Kofleriaceae bacterium]